MASAAVEHDPLVLLRQAIASGLDLVPSESADDEAGADADAPATPLAKATHLRFATQAVSLPLEAPTRFVSNEKPVDLRSIYFAWLNRELAIPEYNASATTLNEELAATGSPGRVQNLGFIERLDLITWLEGASEESEYIKPLAGDVAAAAAAAAAAAGVSTEARPGAGSGLAKTRSGKGALDPRLVGGNNAERRMGDRNTVLRGIKPTDFSHVRKLAIPFLQKKTQSGATAGVNASHPGGKPKSSTRRPDPIILLSPSASSILRMSNARSFLEDGKWEPADKQPMSGVSMLHVQRSMRGIDAHRPMRFILVEGSEQFKPEYWNRIVAVFTTGQLWQFKNYKWSDPVELFKHTLGIYVGWRDEEAPFNIRNWGHRVLSTGLDRYRDKDKVDATDSSRFRDQQVVEQIWDAIETSMRLKGWRADAAPTSI
ncbi:RNA polymerase II accessory factor, Cdc73 [Ophiocordyceps camponoti-floridani]|uniref:RNA polymerase II accessory factor, Cdc73 n=1 Tax=Ophiocordyceps camponoti-floridani TaxID=2030778 RepID=A0A8H4QB26_9HYPO|nr:RNA polymerase II accessory factor, Cdc73 [Ophiocordyceps camponoti-floridani]